MKNKIIQSIPVVLTLLVIGFRYFSNWCIDSIPSCYGSWIHQTFQYTTSPLYIFAICFVLVALILVFIPRQIFISWLKFAVWALPLLFIFVAIQPVNATHILSTNRDDAARLVGEIFAGVSLILIIWKWFVARRQNKVIK